MELLTLDSSVFISALNKSDVFHKETQKFFSILKQRDFQIVIPILIMLEVGNVLMKAGKLKNISVYCEYFYEFDVVNIDLDFVNSIFPKFRKLNLKTSDAIIAATALFYNSKLVTWDKQLILQAKSRVSSITPSEYLKND